MFIRNGQPFNIHGGFTHNGIFYSPGTALRASPSERAAWGITEVPDPIRPDDRYYWVSQNTDGTYSATPKDHVQVRDALIAQLKVHAASLLAPSDWKIVREQETGQPVDDRTRLYRATIRVHSNMLEEQLKACTSIEEVMAVPITWPTADAFQPSIAEAKEARIRAAWDHMWVKLEAATTMVTIGGVQYPFSSDSQSRENIMGINTEISVSPGTVPNPRTWMPKGATVPISVTHADLAAIGVGLRQTKDQYIYIYFGHKAAINALQELSAILAYDFTTGYPA